jgi:hypothetical protein
MNVLQDMLNKALQESFSAENVIAPIIKKKFKSIGISLSDKQQQQLKEQIKTNNYSGSLNFHFEEDDFLECPLALKEHPNSSISLTIDADQELSNIDVKLRNIAEELIPSIASESAEVIYKTLKKAYFSHKKYHGSWLKSFYKSIEEDWGNPIDLLEMLCFLADEAGSEFNSEFRSSASKDNNFVFDVLTRLHARSCQITSEIILLLRSGFADGAHARWRTLHEISIIGYFIAKHGNATAERYICHTATEEFKAAKAYQLHCETLGYEKLTEEAFGAIREKYEYYINKFGKSYRKQNGWASLALGIDDPKIVDIEADVGLAHMRPYYQMACNNVHANPKGIFFKLGLIPESGDVLLTGPSNLGFADPGHSTAISLLQITTKLLLSGEINLDRLVVIKILINLEREIGEAFFKADGKIKERIGANNQ